MLARQKHSEFVFIIVALLFSYYLTQLRATLNQQNEPGSLLALTSYSAYKPFQYRILMPWIANQLYKLKFYPFHSLSNIFSILETTSIFFIILSFRCYISLFIKKNKFVSSLLAFSILYILPFNFLFPRIQPTYYPYDMPSIFFFTLGLVLMYQQKWILFYIIFTLATLNRETSCFLTFIYLLTSIKTEKLTKVILHCCAQFLIWATIKTILFKLFFHNPGQNGFEWHHIGSHVTHLSTNISFLLDIKNYSFFFSNLGFIWIIDFYYYHKIKIEFIRRSMLVIFPFFIGMMFVGNVYEIRIFGELIPVFLMAFLVILMEPSVSRQAIRNSKLT